MISYILAGLAGFTATAIIGVRIYNVYFSWGDYQKMLARYGQRSLSSMTIIVTGCNTGIGKETVRELFKHSARIIMANRNQTQTEDVIREFKQQFPDSHGQLIYKHLDLSSMDSVKMFAQDIIQNESQLDVLVNNAAVFGAPTKITDDGFEVNMQINHLAPALLSTLLMPKLQQSKESDRGRIVAVTSTLTKHGSIKMELLSKINFPHEELAKLVGSNREIYSATKLANLHFMRYLSNAEKYIDICHASPGFCYTRLHRYTSRSRIILMGLFAPLFLMIMKSSKQGAQTIIGCSMVKQVRADVLYHNCKENEMFFQTGVVADSALGQQVFETTMKTIKEYL